jgi:hypothetical protein
MIQDARAALAPLVEAMQADGYILTIEPAESDLQLTVDATADACAECLVPKAMFKSMAATVLADAGVVLTGDIKITYPAAHHES